MFCCVSNCQKLELKAKVSCDLHTVMVALALKCIANAIAAAVIHVGDKNPDDCFSK